MLNSAQPIETLVNRELLSESRILKAPLARSAGGWGQIANGWAAPTDKGYTQMLRLVEKVFKPLEYQDVSGTCGRDEECKCGNCWIRTERTRYRDLKKGS